MVRFNKNTLLLISASGSPGNNGAFFYNSVFAAMEMNAVYLPRQFTDAKTLFESLNSMNIFACSISSPLKTKCIPYLQSITNIAQDLQSVNSIKCVENKTYSGTNTDASGFMSVLIKKNLRPQNILIYGSGSVVPSLVWAIRKCNANANIQIVGRNTLAVESRVQQFSLNTYNPHDSYDLFINATPAQPIDVPELAKLVDRAQTVFDVHAAKKPTELLNYATVHKKIIISGFEMFIEQFVAQFEFYFDKSIPVDILNKTITSFNTNEK